MATDRPVTASPSDATPTDGEDTPKTPNLNIANALTVLRLLLVPVFVVILWPAEVGGTPSLWWWALAVFAVAAATDKLDGYLARSRNLVTDFGKLVDSIADKALIISAMAMLSLLGLLPWWITILMVVRELGITLMRMAMVKREVMAAGKGGKIKMVLQVVFILWLLVPWHTFLAAGVADVLVLIGVAIAFLTLVVAWVSAGQYVADAMRIARRGAAH